VIIKLEGVVLWEIKEVENLNYIFY
jgi:hypothetical protein